MARSCGIHAYLSGGGGFNQLMPLDVGMGDPSPFYQVHVSDAERGDAADEQGGDYAADGDCETLAVDGGEHLARDDAADDAPAYLQDDVEDAGKLGWPVAHEVSTQDLPDTASRSASIVESWTVAVPIP